MPCPDSSRGRGGRGYFGGRGSIGGHGGSRGFDVVRGRGYAGRGKYSGGQYSEKQSHCIVLKLQERLAELDKSKGGSSGTSKQEVRTTQKIFWSFTAIYTTKHA